MNRIFNGKQVVIELIVDPLETKNNPDDIQEAVIKEVGENVDTFYKVGDTILIKNENARPIKHSSFKENERLVYNTDMILCKFQR